MGLFAFSACALFAQQKSGPKPTQTDLPYLLEADKLIPTEAQTVTRSGSKDDETLSVKGSASKARTPLPEPIFLFSAGKISPENFELIRFQVSSSQRQWNRKQQSNPNSIEPDEPLRLTLRPVGNGVTRIEAAEMLSPGEYALMPRGGDTAFCFTVF